MGIRGLETYVETNGLYRRASVAKVVETATRRDPSLSRIAVLDGHNIVRFIYKEDLLRGGEWASLQAALKKLVAGLCRDVGRVVVFFDAALFFPKLDDARDVDLYWSRRVEQLTGDKMLVDTLKEAEQAGEDWESDGRAIKTCLAAMYEVLPLMLQDLGEHVEVLYSSMVTHHGIAAYAKEQNACLMLGQNSECVLYDLRTAYMSLLHLDLDTMTSFHYDPSLLARHLDLDPGLLPLLGTLCGNAECRASDLEQLHRRIARVFSDRRPSLWQLIGPVVRICKTLHGLTSGREVALALQTGLGVRVPAEAIQSSLDLYTLSQKSRYPEPETELYLEAKRRCQTRQDTTFMLTVLRDDFSVIQERACLDCVGIVMQFHPESSLGVYKELVRRLLAIALPAAGKTSMPLYDHWRRAGEVVPESLTEPELLEPPAELGGAPALTLRELWLSADTDPDRRLSWHTFCALLNTGWQPEQLADLPPSLLVPASVLRYLHRYGQEKEHQPTLTEHETRGLLLTALQDRLDPDLVPRHPVQLRVVYATNLFMKGVLYALHALTLCGWPVPAPAALPHRYFGGRVYHHLLHQLQDDLTPAQRLIDGAQVGLYTRLWDLITQ